MVGRSHYRVSDTKPQKSNDMSYYKISLVLRLIILGTSAYEKNSISKRLKIALCDVFIDPVFAIIQSQEQSSQVLC